MFDSTFFRGPLTDMKTNTIHGISVCIHNLLLHFSPLYPSSSDPEQQQTSVTDGGVCRPAVRDLRGSGL